MILSCKNHAKLLEDVRGSQKNGNPACFPALLVGGGA